MAAGGSSFVKMKSGAAKGKLLYVPPAANSVIKEVTGSTAAQLYSGQVAVGGDDKLAVTELGGVTLELPQSILNLVQPKKNKPKKKAAATNLDGLPKPQKQQVTLALGSSVVEVEGTVIGGLAVTKHIEHLNADGTVVEGNYYHVTHLQSSLTATSMHFGKQDALRMMQFLSQTGIDWQQSLAQMNLTKLAGKAIKYGEQMIYQGAVNCPVCGKWKHPDKPCFHCENAAAIAAANQLTLPAATVVSASNLIAAMFDKEDNGKVYHLSSFEQLVAGKHLTAKNANEYGLNLGYILAKEGASGQGRITVSGAWLEAMQQNKGQVELYAAGLVKGTFNEPDGAVTAYAQVVPADDGKPAQLRSYCTCGQNPCGHQMLMQAQALCRGEAQAVIAPNYYQQQVGAHPPYDQQEHFHFNATLTLKAQDAYYRSLQHLDQQGVQLVVGDSSLAALPITPATVSTLAVPAAASDAAVGGKHADTATLPPTPPPTTTAAPLPPIGVPAKATIKVKETATSAPTEVAGLVQGGLAVVQTPKGYKVIHLPSGLSLTVYASSEDGAAALMQQLNTAADEAGFDWRTMQHLDFHQSNAQKLKAVIVEASGQSPKSTNGVWQEPPQPGLKVPKVSDNHVPAPAYDVTSEHKVANIGATDSVMKQAYKQFAQSLTDAEKKALGDYQSNIYYTAINDCLWQDGEGSGEVIAKIKAIDHAIAGARVPLPIRSYRIKPKESSLYQQMQKLAVGDSYLALGYDSTSINPDHAWSGSDNGVRVEYRVPKGAHAVYYNSFSSGYTSEYELLPARGSRWRLIEKKVLPNGKIEVVMELVSQPQQLV